MRARRLTDSFRYAVDGLLYSLRTQRNMRLHLVLALVAIGGAAALGASRMEVLSLVITVMVVLLAEMVNTAVEAAVDLITGTYHPLARIAKNVAAGAVLVSAIGAIIVAFLIFGDEIYYLTKQWTLCPDRASSAILALSASLVLLIVTGCKAFFPGKRLLSRFVPSGFTALSFALAAWVCFRAQEGLTTLIVFTMAVFVGYVRMETGVRSLGEVVSGAVIGMVTACGVYAVAYRV